MPILLVSGPFLSDVAVVLIGIFFLLNWKNKSFFFFLKKNYVIFFILFFISINISSIFSFDPLLSFKSSIPYIRFLFFILGACFILKFNSSAHNIFYKVLLYTLIFIIFDGYIQYFTNLNLLGFVKFDEVRLTGMFHDEPIIGSYIFRLTPLLFYFFFYKNINKNFFIIFLYTVSSLTLVYLSGERTSFILLAIFMFGILFLDKNFFKVIFISLISAALIISALSFLNPNIKKRMISKTTDQLSFVKQIEDKIIIFSDDHHSHIIASINMIKDKPITGHGIKSFRNLCSKKEFRYSEYKTGCSTHPHNFYLQLLAESGFFSFISIFFLFLYILFKLVKNFILFFFKKDFFDKKHCLILWGALFLFLFPFTPSGNFFNNWLNAINLLPLIFLIYEINYKNEKNITNN